MDDVKGRKNGWETTGPKKKKKDKKDISRWGNRTPGCREAFI